ncbi:MAG: LysR family transcriptional regulator [Pirellulaceae bacterium]|nr:LysR family transcriptional regulator [Planctomycetales bacterium]MCA9210276.1 LysR family transcriptional regulator [Planctomycetales bacterium]MCA9225558.1 LysR family transcriptional regulator [Planctomycetales bacterium]
MHVKALKVFCDVVSRRSFSRAADENGMTQSGASQLIHHLEDELGVKLIDRSKRPFVLTPEGEVYYDGCRKLVQRMTTLEEEVKTLHQDVSGRVNVASIYSVGLSYMNSFVREFRRGHPRATVRMQYQHPNRVYELVRTDQADIGLVSYPRASRSVKVIEWRREPMMLVCSPDHPLAVRSSVTPDELDGLEMIGFDDDLTIRQQIDRALSAQGIEVEVVMDFDNIETLKSAVQINSGVSLLPVPTVERELSAGTLVAVPISGMELFRPLGIILRRGAELGKTARRFLQLLIPQSSSPDGGEANDKHSHDTADSGGAPASTATDAAENARRDLVGTTRD